MSCWEHSSKIFPKISAVKHLGYYKSISIVYNKNSELSSTMTDSLKDKIFDKLEYFSEPTLAEILDFLEFLEWRNQKSHRISVSENTDNLQADDAAWLNSDLSNLGSYEPYDWQPGELEAGLPVKYVPGQGIIIIEE